MHPILFEVFGTPVTAYGAALSLSFALGILVARFRGRSRGIDPELVTEVSILIFVTSMLGSRLLFAVENPHLFSPPEGSWTRLFAPLLKHAPSREMAGLSMSGGVVLAVASTLAFLRFRGAPVLRVADLLAPSVALGEAVTRIGCFFNGCCHGIVCGLPWGTTFPPESPASRAFGEIPVHPTQLYTSIASLAIFVLLLRLARSEWARQRDGVVFLAWMMLASGMRLWVDSLRHYEVPAGAAALLPHQPLVIAMFALGLAGMAFRIRHRPG